MNKFFVLLLFVALLNSLAPSAGYAQDGVCNGILRDGVMRETRWHQSSEAKLVLLARISQMDFNSATQALGHTGEVGWGPLKIGPGTWNSEKHEELKKTLEELVDVDQVLKSQSSLLLSSGDQVIADAWSRCLLAAGGLTFILKTSGRDAAIAEITWTPFPTAPNTNPKVVSFEVLNGRLRGDNMYAKPGTSLGIRARRIVSLTREAGKDLTVILNTDLGGEHGYLPPPIASKPPRVKAKLCRIIFASNDNDTRNTQFVMEPKALVKDCATLARAAGATDARVGCRDGADEIVGEQRFAVTIGHGYDPKLSAQGPPVWTSPET